MSFKKEERAALYFTMSDIVHTYRPVCDQLFIEPSPKFTHQSENTNFITFVLLERNLKIFVIENGQKLEHGNQVMYELNVIGSSLNT